MVQTKCQHVAERLSYLLRCCLVNSRYVCCPINCSKNVEIHSFPGLYPHSPVDVLEGMKKLNTKFALKREI